MARRLIQRRIRRFLPGGELDKYTTHTPKITSREVVSPEYDVSRTITYEDGVPVDTIYSGLGWDMYSGPYVLMINDHDYNSPLEFRKWTDEELSFWLDLTKHFDSLEDKYKNSSFIQKMIYNLRQFFGISGSQRVNLPQGTSNQFSKRK